MFRIFIVAIACLSFGPTLVMGQTAKEPRVQFEKTLGADAERRVMRMGRQVVDHVGNGLAYLIVTGDVNGAMLSITKALVDISKLQNKSLAFKQETEITDKKGLVTMDQASLSKNVIPLYDQVRMTSVDAMKQQLGDTPASPIVTRVEWQEIRRTLDLDIAEKTLKKSMRALRAHKTKEAIEILNSFYGGAVTYEMDAVSLPLYRVAQNLMLAKVAIEDGKDKDARAALKEAVKGLKVQEKTASGMFKDDVTSMRKSIEARMDAISKEPDKGAELVQKWWDKVIDWFHEK